VSLHTALRELKDANLAVEIAMDSGREYPEVEQRHSDALDRLVQSLVAQGISPDDAASMAGAIA